MINKNLAESNLLNRGLEPLNEIRHQNERKCLRQTQAKHRTELGIGSRIKCRKSHRIKTRFEGNKEKPVERETTTTETANNKEVGKEIIPESAMVHVIVLHPTIDEDRHQIGTEEECARKNHIHLAGETIKTTAIEPETKENRKDLHRVNKTDKEVGERMARANGQEMGDKETAYPQATNNQHTAELTQDRGPGMAIAGPITQHGDKEMEVWVHRLSTICLLGEATTELHRNHLRCKRPHISLPQQQ